MEVTNGVLHSGVTMTWFKRWLRRNRKLRHYLWAHVPNPNWASKRGVGRDYW